MPDLTPEEHEFLMDSDGGIAGAFGGPTALTEADAVVLGMLAKLVEMYPNRIQRLALLSRVASFANTEKQRLLDEVLEGRYQWTLGSTTDPDDWRAMAWQPYETRRLSQISCVHPNTLRARIKVAATKTLKFAKHKAASSTPEEIEA